MNMKATWKRPVGPSAANDGFTIAELLMAVAILFIVLMGVLGAVQFAAGSTRQASVRQGAIELANQKIEFARDMPYQALGTKNADGTYNDPPGVLPVTESVTTTIGTYTVVTNVWWQRDTGQASAQTALYKRVSVTVSWTLPNPASVRAETAVYGVDTNAVTGDVQLTALDEDGNSPVYVPGITVTLDPAGSAPARSVTTASDGTAFFGQVPYGAISAVTVSSSSYMADMTDFWASNITTVSPNVVNSWVLKVQKPKSAVITVQGTDGQRLQVPVNLTLTDPNDPYHSTQIGTMTGTTSNGQCTFGNLWTSKPAGTATYLIKASYPGKADASATFEIKKTDTQVNVTLTMNDQAQAKIIVSSQRGGGAITNGTVTIASGSQNGVGTSQSLSSTGTAAFNITQSGNYYFDVVATGYVTKYAVSASPAFIDKNLGGVVIYVQLVPIYPFTITVLDAYNSAAVSGLNVELRDSSNNLDGSGTTNSSGQVSTSITTTDTYTVKVTDSASLYQAFTSASFPINVITDATPGSKSVSVITGRILATLQTKTGGVPTHSGGYTVYLYSNSSYSTLVASANSNSSGQVLFGPLATGTYYLRVKSGTTWYNFSPTSIVVSAGQSAPFTETYKASGTEIQ